jgi:hypothetical protein
MNDQSTAIVPLRNILHDTLKAIADDNRHDCQQHLRFLRHRGLSQYGGEMQSLNTYQCQRCGSIHTL